MNDLVFAAPWIFQLNAMTSKPNIRLLLNLPFMLATIMSLLQFKTTLDSRWLLLPLAIDVSLNVISLIVCSLFQESMGINSDNAFRYYATETIGLCAKCFLLYVYWTFTQHKQSDSFGLLVLFATLLLVFAMGGSKHQRIYTSLLSENYSHLLMLSILLGFKLGGSTYGWHQTFIIQLFLGYFLFGILCIFGLLVILGLVAVAWLRICHPLVFAWVAFYVRAFVEACVMIALIQLACADCSYWIGDVQVILIVYAVALCIEAIAYLSVRQGLDLTELFKKADNKIEKRQGLGQVLDLIQKSPTFFAFTGNAQPAQGEEEPQQCIICYANDSNCVVFPCLHGGICSECAEMALKKNPNCSMCKQAVEKIAVIKKRSDGKFDVLEEIFISN